MQFRDRAVLVEDTLVLSDLHVGKEATAVEFPVGERSDLVERLSALLAWGDPETVVLAGDVLHSFGSVPTGAAETLHDVERVVRDAGAAMVVTPGNHDRMLDGVWHGPTTEHHRVGDTLVCHGHERPDEGAARYVVGHDHPTIEVEGKRRPCYLVGEQGGHEVVMLPAFTRLVRGVVVNGMRAHEFQSPLVTDADALRPVVWDDDAGEPLEFPPLGEFRGML